MATTEFRIAKGEGWWVVHIPLVPVPASRPRVSRWGTYYSKTYATWKAAAEVGLRPLGVPEDELTTAPVYVMVECIAKRPQKLTRPYPRPDTDNYIKAALDVITKSQTIWRDDDQVVVLVASKRYAVVGEEPFTLVRCATLDGPVTGMDVYDLPAALRVPLEDLE